MRPGSVTEALTRTSPPHRGQRWISMPNTRCRRALPLIGARRGPAASSGGPRRGRAVAWGTTSGRWRSKPISSRVSGAAGAMLRRRRGVCPTVMPARRARESAPGVTRVGRRRDVAQSAGIGWGSGRRTRARCWPARWGPAQRPGRGGVEQRGERPVRGPQLARGERVERVAQRRAPQQRRPGFHADALGTARCPPQFGATTVPSAAGTPAPTPDPPGVGSPCFAAAGEVSITVSIMIS